MIDEIYWCFCVNGLVTNTLWRMTEDETNPTINH